MPFTHQDIDVLENYVQELNTTESSRMDDAARAYLQQVSVIVDNLKRCAESHEEPASFQWPGPPEKSSPPIAFISTWLQNWSENKLGKPKQEISTPSAPEKRPHAVTTGIDDLKEPAGKRRKPAAKKRKGPKKSSNVQPPTADQSQSADTKLSLEKPPGGEAGEVLGSGHGKGIISHHTKRLLGLLDGLPETKEHRECLQQSVDVLVGGKPKTFYYHLTQLKAQVPNNSEAWQAIEIISDLVSHYYPGV